MDTLVIAEKPSVALRLAIALGDNRQKRMSLNGVSYYQIDNPDGRIYIAPAVGHIFTLVQAKHERGYPVLDIKWAPSYESNPKSEFTKKYLDVLRELSKKVGAYVNACDYDTEGTVIGTNVIRFTSSEGLKNAKRMKFSTTTTSDLKESFENLQPFDMNNFYAGETRHMLDWLWGINLSRALTSADSRPPHQGAQHREGAGADARHTGDKGEGDSSVQAAALLEALHNREGDRVHQHQGGDLRQEGRRSRRTRQPRQAQRRRRSARQRRRSSSQGPIRPST